MGHSIQVFNNKHIIAKDFDTSIMLRELINIIQDDPKSNVDLIPLVDEWELTLDAYATGCLDMCLETIEGNTEAIIQLNNAISVCEESFKSMGTEIKKCLINEKYKLGGVGSSVDYPTERVLAVIDELKELVSDAD